MHAFAVGTLGGEEGVCAERVQCVGLAHAYARGTLCGEGRRRVQVWMEVLSRRRSDAEGAVAVREVVGGGETGSRREGGSCGCGGRMIDLAGS